MIFYIYLAHKNGQRCIGEPMTNFLRKCKGLLLIKYYTKTYSKYTILWDPKMRILMQKIRGRGQGCVQDPCSLCATVSKGSRPVVAAVGKARRLVCAPTKLGGVL